MAPEPTDRATDTPERKISQAERKISQVERKISQVVERKISQAERKISQAERKISAIGNRPEANLRERKISSISAVKVYEGEGSDPIQHHNNNFHHHAPVSHETLETKVDEILQIHDHPIDKVIRVKKSAQFLTAIAANFGAFALGAVMAWSATGLPSLRSNGELGTLSKSEEAWIGSIVTLAALFSCPFAAYAMVTWGRRRTMLYLNGPFVFGWMLIAFADIIPTFLTPVYTIYFGRVLTGFCGGAYSVIAPVFIAECSHDKLRGTLASGFDLMLSVGMLYIYVIGAFTSWQIQAIACGLIPIVCHGLLLLVSESPRFLVEQGRITEANQAISWLFGFKGDFLAAEVAGINKSVEESNAKPVNVDRVIMKLSVLKPILICIAIMFFYTLCVYDAVIFYTVDIFKSTGSSLDPKDSAIILGVVGVVASLPAAAIVDKAGRRLLLLLSEFLLSLSLAAMGSFFYITSEDTPDNALHIQYGWLPLTALNIFLIGYSLGLGPIALLIVGEIVPSHIKGLTTCVALMIRWLLGFAVTNCFESVQIAIGLDKTYWIFSFVCAVGFVFIFFCVPETKGKSLDDIQTGFISKAKIKALEAANGSAGTEFGGAGGGGGNNNHIIIHPFDHQGKHYPPPHTIATKM